MNIKKVDSNKYSEMEESPSVLVYHSFELYTDSNSNYHTVDDIIDFLATSDYNASANYLVHTDGIIYQIVPPSLASWHSGRSHFYGKHIDHSVNKFSIGIEIVRSEYENYEYTPQQYYSLSNLSEYLMKSYPIPPLNLTTHEYVRREYNTYAESHGMKKKDIKNDPYKFDWNLFYSVLFGLNRIGDKNSR